MLKVYGSFYSESKESFNEVKRALENDGFQIAYSYETNGVILKEVASLNENEDNDNAES